VQYQVRREPDSVRIPPFSTICFLAYCRRGCVVPDSDGISSKPSRLRSRELPFGRASPGSFAERRCAGLHPPQGQDARTERSGSPRAPERPWLGGAYHIPHSLSRYSNHSADHQGGCVGFSNQARIIGPLQAVGRAVAHHDATRSLKGTRSRIATLTPREREVFELVIRGHTNNHTARSLGCTERTIKAHRHRVMEKMQVRSLPELVSLAERVGVMSGIGHSA
jgi:DNA-binding CsgD family transcriptional regulator